jgi:hypothetical protein
MKNKIIFGLLFLLTFSLVNAGTLSDSFGSLTYDGVNICLADGSVAFTDTVTIDQNSNGIALNIDSQNTGQSTVRIVNNAAQTASDSEVVEIKQANPSSTKPVIRLINEGTGNGLLIDQNGNGIGLSIDSEASTSRALTINSISSAGGFYMEGSGNLGTNSAFFDILATGIQNSNGYGIRIDDTGMTGQLASLLEVTKDSGNQISSLGRISGSSIAGNWFYRNYNSTVTNSPLVFIEQDNAGDDQNALSIQNDGTGNGLFINQNGNAKALNIDSEATSTGIANFYTNAVHTGTGFSSNVAVRVDNPSSTGDAVYIQQDGTGNGLLIDQNGNGYAQFIDHEGTDTPALVIQTTTTSAPIIQVAGGEGGCSVGDYGFYTLSGNLYWCKNGVSTQLN